MSMICWCSEASGDPGGVSSCCCWSLVGVGPGEHVSGRCLLGTAVGFPRTDVLMFCCELDARVFNSAGLAQTVAMRALWSFGAGRCEAAQG